MNQHRKVFVRIVGGSILTILANLAFAPIFQAGAISFSANAPATVIARNDQPLPTQRRDSARTPSVPQPTRDAQSTTPAQSEQPAAPTPPSNEPDADEFDGYTTFAVNEVSSNHLGADFDAHPFNALGGGAAANSTAITRHASRSNHVPSGAPHGSNGAHQGAENPPAQNTPATGGASDQPSDDKPTDKPTDYAGINKPGDDVSVEQPTPEVPTASVPEPSSIALLLVGMCALVTVRHFA